MHTLTVCQCQGPTTRLTSSQNISLLSCGQNTAHALISINLYLSDIFLIAFSNNLPGKIFAGEDNSPVFVELPTQNL